MNIEGIPHSEQDESDLVQAHFKETYRLFQQCAFHNGEPILCQLHDAFGTFNSPHHNCLGCNFSDSTELILNFLSTYSMQRDIQYTFSTFIMLAYLLVERIDTLLDIIELNRTYRAEHFRILSAIRKWANFLKHPKAFILTHHPIFTFKDAPNSQYLARDAKVLINRDFVDTYYSSEDRNQELFKILENEESVVVFFPNAVEMAKKLCDAMADCVSVIRDNKIYREVIESKTTFYDYWIDKPGA